MKIAEYTERARRLRRLVPDLEIEFNEDEGLTLVGEIDGKRVVLTGETDIVGEMERLAVEAARKALESIESGAKGPLR